MTRWQDFFACLFFWYFFFAMLMLFSLTRFHLLLRSPYLESSCLCLHLGIFLLWFSLGVSKVQVCDPFELILYEMRNRDLVSTSTHEYPISSAPLREDMDFYLVHAFVTLVRRHMAIAMWAYFCVLCYNQLIYISVSVSVSTMLPLLLWFCSRLIIGDQVLWYLQNFSFFLPRMVLAFYISLLIL